MASGAGGGQGRGGNGGCREGRCDAGAGSSTRPGFFLFGSGGNDGRDRAWLRFLQLGQHLAPATSKLCTAKMTLRATNAAVLAGAAVHRTVAKAAYDIAYDEYKEACERFIRKP